MINMFGSGFSNLLGLNKPPPPPPKEDKQFFSESEQKNILSVIDSIYNSLPPKKKEGGPVNDMNIVAGGPPDRGMNRFGSGNVKKFIQ
jgi:hypothetical protein